MSSLPALQALRFDVTGWAPDAQSEDEVRWTSALGDVLSLHLIAVPPEFPAGLDVQGLRAFYRKLTVEAGGGILEVDVVSQGQLRLVRTLCKFPQRPTGMAYIGSLALPFAEFSYLIKVQCPEQAITGLRDTLILSTLIPPDDQDPQRWVEEEWAKDPYEPSDRSRLRRNLSEDEQYDAEFPDHPLSRARRYLASILRTLEVEPSLREAAPF